MCDVFALQALALSTSALLFMLSRDRRMEIDKTTLQLLLKLLDPLERELQNREDSPAKGELSRKVNIFKEVL